MATISKIRLANIQYEGGLKRYNDETFLLDGNNTALILENGGGKTVLVQMILQAVLPRHNHSGRKVWETLQLSSGAAHIAIEWLLDERPRRYLLTALTLYLNSGKLESNLYVTEYISSDKGTIEDLPFSIDTEDGKKRPASNGEINDYYLKQKKEHFNSKTFDTITSYQEYLEKNYQLSYKEWLSISKINSSEGGIEDFFNNCATTPQLVNNLLIPTIEEAIEGENTELFADIFEEHRQHIKEYKRLTSVIEENQNIQSNLADYVDTCKLYHGKKEGFNLEKAVIKGLYQKAITERESSKRQIDKIFNEKELLNEALGLWEKKKASYELGTRAVEQTAAEKEYLIFKDKVSQLEIAIQDTQYRINKLTLEKLKQEYSTKNMKIETIQRQLETLDQSSDADALIEEREHYEAQLLYVFNGALKGLEERKQKYEREVFMMSSQLSDAQASKEALRQEQMRLTKNIGEEKGTIKEINNTLERYKSELLQLESFEQVKSYRELCSKKLKDLTLEHEALKVIILETEEVIAELHQSNDEYALQMTSLESQRASIQERIETINVENTSLYTQFLELSGKPLVGRDVYTSSADMEKFLTQELSVYQEERELLISQEAEYNYKETLFSDIDVFIADPSLKQRTEQLNKNFNYVELGTSYLLQHYSESEIKRIYEVYPYWPITLITLESEKEKMWKHIMMDREQITYPVVLLSDKEVKAIASGKWEKIERFEVMPKSWLSNLSEENFNAWKEKNRQLLENYKEKRKEHEQKIKAFEMYLTTMSQFLKKYPYEIYEELKDNLNKILLELDAVKASFEINRTSVNDKQGLLEKKRKRLEVVLEEKASYERQLEITVKVISELRAYDESNRRLVFLEKRLEKLIDDLGQIVRLVQELSISKDEIQNEIYGLNRGIDRIEEDPIFKRIQGCHSVLSNYTKEELIVLLAHVDQQLSGVLGQRQELENNQRELLSECNDLSDKIEDYQEKTRDFIQAEEMVLVGNGVKQIKHLETQFKELNKLKNTARTNMEVKKTHFDKLSGAVETLKSNFYKKYDEIIIFEEPLELIKETLRREETNIKAELNQISQKVEKEEKLLDDIKKVIEELERKHERYDYLADSIQAIDVSESLYNDYQYNRFATIKKVIQNIEKIHQDTLRAFHAKEQKKNEFKTFCVTHITDPKLKNSTISFIDNRDTFEELNQWKEKIQEKIGHVLKMSEINLKEVDKEIVKLIDRLYIYLTKVVEELNILESKTKIKLKNDTKRVFKIKTPEFSEATAKQAIRDHLIWMTNKIQEGPYLKDDGNEDMTEVRKNVTLWLSTKTLLRKIFLSKEITVQCRKVTNDFQIKGLLTDWGHTNKWSGGEKWSKNMTLYLGIQNYLAEKRYVNVAKSKLNRVVLLDNPFGAASSGHVLEPVFLIAEQLGYQLIALTAHSEGKFISDYFPIVYSCKLRSSKDNRIQIMTKEKEVNYAYLRDHNPMSIYRLEEDERHQLDLFSNLLI